jgi:hypothetical protein
MLAENVILSDELVHQTDITNKDKRVIQTLCGQTCCVCTRTTNWVNCPECKVEQEMI